MKKTLLLALVLLTFLTSCQTSDIGNSSISDSQLNMEKSEEDSVLADISYELTIEEIMNINDNHKYSLEEKIKFYEEALDKRSDEIFSSNFEEWDFVENYISLKEEFLVREKDNLLTFTETDFVRFKECENQNDTYIVLIFVPQHYVGTLENPVSAFIYWKDKGQIHLQKMEVNLSVSSLKIVRFIKVENVTEDIFMIGGFTNETATPNYGFITPIIKKDNVFITIDVEEVQSPNIELYEISNYQSTIIIVMPRGENQGLLPMQIESTIDGFIFHSSDDEEIERKLSVIWNGTIVFEDGFIS